MLLGITDLHSIQFLLMTRGPDNSYTFKVSPPMDDVLDVLCSLLVSPNDARQSRDIPSLVSLYIPGHGIAVACNTFSEAC